MLFQKLNAQPLDQRIPNPSTIINVNSVLGNTGGNTSCSVLGNTGGNTSCGVLGNTGGLQRCSCNTQRL